MLTINHPKYGDCEVAEEMYEYYKGFYEKGAEGFLQSARVQVLQSLNRNPSKHIKGLRVAELFLIDARLTTIQEEKQRQKLNRKKT
jgi:hypothetical protein